MSLPSVKSSRSAHGRSTVFPSPSGASIDLFCNLSGQSIDGASIPVSPSIVPPDFPSIRRFSYFRDHLIAQIVSNEKVYKKKRSAICGRMIAFSFYCSSIVSNGTTKVMTRDLLHHGV